MPRGGLRADRLPRRESATATLADETGDIEVDVDVAAAATLENGVVEIFAFQGDRLGHRIGFMRIGPSLLSLPSDDTDTNVEVRVVGLRPGEVGRIEVCPWAGFVCSVDPVRSYTVVGTGSDDLTVNVAARGFGSMGLWLYVNDVLAPVGGIPVKRIPGSAEQLPPGTLDVSPASVLEPGRYTFTVTGSGWTAEGPIFVWACASGISLQEVYGYPMDCGTGRYRNPGHPRPCDSGRRCVHGREALRPRNGLLHHRQRRRPDPGRDVPSEVREAMTAFRTSRARMSADYTNDEWHGRIEVDGVMRACTHKHASGKEATRCATEINEQPPVPRDPTPACRLAAFRRSDV